MGVQECSEVFRFENILAQKFFLYKIIICTKSFLVGASLHYCRQTVRLEIYL